MSGERIDGFAFDIGSEGELQVNCSAPHAYVKGNEASLFNIRAGDIIHLR